MELAEFNSAPAAQARAVVQPCADIGWWVGRVLGGRPYPDVASLLEQADHLARDWAEIDVDRALSQHPRIGERHRGPAHEAALSAAEQSGVAPDADLQEQLHHLNVQYENTFGRVFLIRAAGRSGAEVLAELQRRLTNDPDTERLETASQLREIALLRLKSAVS